MDSSLFFFILSLCCLFLILDMVYGNQLIKQFLVAVNPELEK